MNKKASNEIAGAVNKLLKEKEKLEKLASQQRKTLSALEKRAMAEDILMAARNAPSQYRASGIDDFIHKRRELESKTVEELQKIADVVNMISVDDSGMVHIVDGPANNSDKPETFDDWFVNWRNENDVHS